MREWGVAVSRPAGHVIYARCPRDSSKGGVAQGSAIRWAGASLLIPERSEIARAMDQGEDVDVSLARVVADAPHERGRVTR